MKSKIDRRDFITRYLSASAMFVNFGTFAGGSAAITRPIGQKVKLAVVGLSGAGFNDWMPMVQSGMAEVVAFCDADRTALDKIAQRILAEKKKGRVPDDFMNPVKIPFFTDYRKLLDNCPKFGVEAMTISTPDHVHAPVAILAMKIGIHVYVQNPLVRTVGELDYFKRTADECGVITQLALPGSSLDSMRRATEVIQSGILGDVSEVHVWTNSPVWPQGKAVENWIKGHPDGNSIPPGLDWNAWLATAKKRPFLGPYSKDAGVHDPWKLCKNVYHNFSWRGFFDFGCGAFGEAAYLMDLPFRALELGRVSDVECVKIESANSIAYPLKSAVRFTYGSRVSKIQRNADGSYKRLPCVTLCWYDGGEMPDAAVLSKWTASGRKIPTRGCYIVGSKGAGMTFDALGANCVISLNDEKVFSAVFKHEAAKAVPRSIPFCDAVGTGVGKHTLEFIKSVRGEGTVYAKTHTRCFSDVACSVPLTEGILIGCVAQRVPGKLKWLDKSNRFDSVEANALMKPYVRKGFEF